MSKTGTLAQIHLHTAETSRCGVGTGAEMARACREAGYDLLVITDHFFNANIGCDSGLPWEDKVEYLFRGYRAARAEGEKIGLTVLKAWETFTAGPEYITLGLDEAFLLANPGVDKVSKEEYCARVHAAGGYIIHAHPYREAPYIPKFTPDYSLVDGSEVFNGGNQDRDPQWDVRARAEAMRRGVPMTAGSDAHRVTEVRRGGMRFPGKITGMDELIAALKAGTGEIVETL
ncbi:MAG: PHP domain-containing protein [Clostridiales bacterium]|nr:PHP domain-containing protein [Clostridiales bacterium]